MKTLIAIPCMDMVNTLFVQSLLGMRRTGRAEFGIACSSLVYDARNALARKAIVEKFDRVLWLDSDMVFDPDFMERLNADLDAGRDMVSGLYFTRKLPLKPVIFNECGYYRRNEETMEVVPTAKTYYDYPKDSIFEVAACGFGGVLMNVSLLEEVEEKFGLPFAPIVGFGEDISFCLRVSELGKKDVLRFHGADGTRRIFDHKRRNLCKGACVMLAKVKMALRVTTDAFDSEITDLISAACADLGIVGVTATSSTTDALLIRAIITYCRLHFGQPDDYDRLKASYDEQKAQLITASGYGLPGGA